MKQARPGDRVYSDYRIKLYKEVGKLARVERRAPTLAEVAEEELRRFRAAQALRAARPPSSNPG